MTNKEFIERLSLAANSVSPFMQYSAEELEAKIQKVYPDKFDLNKIVEFFLTTGALTLERSEKISCDKLTFALNWINRVELWTDINCVVNAIGYVENCSGRINRFLFRSRENSIIRSTNLLQKILKIFSNISQRLNMIFTPK